MRQASATCGGSRNVLLPPYKICASILKDLSALLRILKKVSVSLPHKADAHIDDVRVSILFDHERSESNMPSLVAPGKVASTKPPIEATASRMSGV